METLLDWAVGQVNRYQLQLIFYANSTEWVDGALLCSLSYQEALDRLGDVSLINPDDSLQPGQEVEFSLSKLPTSIGVQINQTDGTDWFAYLDWDNRYHIIYLENATSVINPVQLAVQYNLWGVDIRSLPDQPNQAPFWTIVQEFLSQAASS